MAKSSGENAVFPVERLTISFGYIIIKEVKCAGFLDNNAKNVENGGLLQ
ncbi:MAG TPA: hypothetical protein IAB55_10860 [Candidatus Merdivicinus faecavium]|nr:hypothetical protein [Candidatus Merdivicinus faecavium]